MKESVFCNTLGEEIDLSPLYDLLLKYRDLYEKLVLFLTEETFQSVIVSSTRIQRRFMVRYEKAEAVMKALLGSKIAVEAHEPIRTELCLDDKTGKMIAEALRGFYEGHRPTVVENYRSWLAESSSKNHDDGSSQEKTEGSQNGGGDE